MSLRRLVLALICFAGLAAVPRLAKADDVAEAREHFKRGKRSTTCSATSRLPPYREDLRAARRAVDVVQHRPGLSSRRQSSEGARRLSLVPGALPRGAQPRRGGRPHRRRAQDHRGAEAHARASPTGTLNGDGEHVYTAEPDPRIQQQKDKELQQQREREKEEKEKREEQARLDAARLSKPVVERPSGPPPRTLRISGLAVGGFGVASLALGAAFAALTASANDGLHPSPPGYYDGDLYSRGTTYQTLYPVFLAVGGVALVTGVVLYAVGLKHGHGTQGSSRSATTAQARPSAGGSDDEQIPRLARARRRLYARRLHQSERRFRQNLDLRRRASVPVGVLLRAGIDSPTTHAAAACNCAVPDDPCQEIPCVDGACGAQRPVADGTAARQQTSGDCKKLVCDGQGNANPVADPNDLPGLSSDECNDKSCDGTNVVSKPKPGMQCGSNGFCNTIGACSDCATGNLSWARAARRTAAATMGRGSPGSRARSAAPPARAMSASPPPSSAATARRRPAVPTASGGRPRRARRCAPWACAPISALWAPRSAWPTTRSRPAAPTASGAAT